MVKFHDYETNTSFIFLTNNFKLTPFEIALLHKYR